MKKKKPTEKMYIVRKYIMAKDIKSCMRKEKTHTPDEINFSSDWVESGNQHLAEAIGFHQDVTEEDEYED